MVWRTNQNNYLFMQNWKSCPHSQTASHRTQFIHNFMTTLLKTSLTAHLWTRFVHVPMRAAPSSQVPSAWGMRIEVRCCGFYQLMTCPSFTYNAPLSTHFNHTSFENLLNIASNVMSSPVLLLFSALKILRVTAALCHFIVQPAQLRRATSDCCLEG